MCRLPLLLARDAKIRRLILLLLLLLLFLRRGVVGSERVHPHAQQPRRDGGVGEGVVLFTIILRGYQSVLK